jgi:hypothetical protein
MESELISIMSQIAGVGETIAIFRLEDKQKRIFKRYDPDQN